MSPSLYQLTEDMVALDTLLAEIGGDVSSPEGQTLEAWAEKFQWQMSDKVDAYGGLYTNMEADAKALGDEIKRLQARKRAVENRQSRLLALAKFSMERLKTRKLEGQRFTIALQKNGGLLPMEVLVDAKALPEAFRKEETVYTAKADELRAALEKRAAALGKEIPDPDPYPELEGKAVLGARGESVRIK